MTVGFWADGAHMCHTARGMHVPCWCDLDADHYGTRTDSPGVVDAPAIDTYEPPREAS